MKARSPIVNLTANQERILRILFKFRFATVYSIAHIISNHRSSVYDVLEGLITEGLVIKVYAKEFRINRRAAYYYLSPGGVTQVKKIMDVKEATVHTLYNNGTASEEFIDHCLKLIEIYPVLRSNLPEDSNIFSKQEINRFNEFPKNRPDFYIRTPEGKEGIVVLADDRPAYIIRKQRDEIISHSENEGWTQDTYPYIYFILKDSAALNTFLYTTRKKLEELGVEEHDLHIRATYLSALNLSSILIWYSPDNQKQAVSLFE